MRKKKYISICAMRKSFHTNVHQCEWAQTELWNKLNKFFFLILYFMCFELKQALGSLLHRQACHTILIGFPSHVCIYATYLYMLLLGYFGYSTRHRLNLKKKRNNLLQQRMNDGISLTLVHALTKYMRKTHAISIMPFKYV